MARLSIQSKKQGSKKHRGIGVCVSVCVEGGGGGSGSWSIFEKEVIRQRRESS